MFSAVLGGHLAVPFPGEPPLLAVVHNDSPDGHPTGIALAALRVPSYPLIAVLDPDLAGPGTATDALVDALAARRETIVGFTGRRRTALLLAESWLTVAGRESKPRMWENYYRLGELKVPVDVPGESRLATTGEQDVDVLAHWFAEFRRETGIGRTLERPDPESVVRNLERGEVFTLWCVDGRPVAVAGHSPVRRAAAKIAPVYTPPDLRRRGFGSAVTAAAVRSAQHLGAGQVTLFTDADYPAANLVYRQLGFEMVAEFAEFDLVEDSTST
jgi:ribosomal protein S18 acetylase RimI-like enzyme